MEPLDLWPFAVLAWLLGHLFGVLRGSRHLVRIWKRCGPVRSVTYGLGTLLVAGLFVAGVFALVLVLPWEGDRASVKSLFVLIILFGTMAALSFGTALVSLRFRSAHTRRRVTVEIIDG